MECPNTSSDAAGLGGNNMYTGYTSDNWKKASNGARYGDGVGSNQGTFGGGGGGGGGTYTVTVGAGGAGGVTFGAKSFNGILGRCVGGGGAGAPREDNNYGSTAHSGGEGGSGGGGGGGCSHTSQGNGHYNWQSWASFSPVDLALYIPASTAQSQAYWQSGQGGHGGALGGGGGGSYHSAGGAGGIGGGGGGGHGWIYSSPAGSGPGGPGYLLIEW